MKKSDYEKLVRMAHEAQEAYEKGFPTGYTDDEYDKIIRDIRTVESIHPSWIAPESPTQVVGVSDKTDGFEKARHDVPMLSILDVFDEDSVRKFVRTVKSVHPDAVFSVEVKIDGLSMSVSYENGKLTRAETRGDGEVASKSVVKSTWTRQASCLITKKGKRRGRKRQITRGISQLERFASMTLKRWADAD